MTVLDAIKNRRSVRKYDSKTIPAAVMEKLCDSLRLAPSACNFQPWRFLLVTGPDLKDQLVNAARAQSFIAEAPLIVVGCGFPDDAYKSMGGHGNSIEVDIAIAMTQLTLAAVEEGLGTCWIGAFDEKQVKATLNIPKNARVVAMTPVGYPSDPDMIRPVEDGRRKSAEEIFFMETYD